MEIEKDEEFSTCSELDTDAKSINETIEKVNKPPNNFIKEINTLKCKLYQDQFKLLLNKYRFDNNSLNKMISNYAKSKNINIEMDYNNYICYSESLITKIYNIKYFLKENKIDELINEIRDINEKILNNNLLFDLHGKKLYHYIKNNMVGESLKYAQNNMISLTENNNILYKQLEKIMSLLAYKNINYCADKELVNEFENIIDKIEDETIYSILKFLIGGN